MLIYLCRHAQTASSAVDSFNGQRELPLTEQGRAQAAALGARLKSVSFAAVYRSPLGRTGETSTLIAPALSASILPGLTEIHYGDWEGLSPTQAREKSGQRFDDWQRDPVNISPPAGETIAEVAARAQAALQEILARQSVATGPVLVVSHKATIRALGAALSGAPLASYRTRWAQDECALNLIELRANKDPFIRLWNDTSHLGPDPAKSTRSGH